MKGPLVQREARNDTGEGDFLSFRTSAHTGVGIRFPAALRAARCIASQKMRIATVALLPRNDKGCTDCHVATLLAMTRGRGWPFLSFRGPLGPWESPGARWQHFSNCDERETSPQEIATVALLPRNDKGCTDCHVASLLAMTGSKQKTGAFERMHPMVFEITDACAGYCTGNNR